jgi:hypothetical protein
VTAVERDVVIARRSWTATAKRTSEDTGRDRQGESAIAATQLRDIGD